MHTIIHRLVLVALMFGACSKLHAENDPALQTALDELTRLNAYTKTGLSFNQYSDRVLTASGNIEAALRRNTDVHAKGRIKAALVYYVLAWDLWRDYTEKGNPSLPSLVQEFWAKGANAISEAERYVSADKATRTTMDAERDKKMQQEFKELRKKTHEVLKDSERAIEENDRRTLEKEHAEGFITLKQDVSLPTNLFPGMTEVTVYAGTKVLMISHDAPEVQIRYMNRNYFIPISATNLQ